VFVCVCVCVRVISVKYAVYACNYTRTSAPTQYALTNLKRKYSERQAHAQGVNVREEGGGMGRLDSEGGGGTEADIDDRSLQSERESQSDRARAVFSSPGWQLGC